MDLGSNFSAKLEPFLLMAKSMKGAAAAKLVEDATAAPGVFALCELLELPNIQESFRLLEFFAFRTYQDYLREKDSLPALNQAQTIKLKHLSIVSMASERRILPYSELLQVLQMPTIRELEDLIIDAIYLDILRSKLDQKEEQLEIEHAMGRDLEPGKIESILAALNAWCVTSSFSIHCSSQPMQDRYFRQAVIFHQIVGNGDHIRLGDSLTSRVPRHRDLSAHDRVSNIGSLRTKLY
ncbi:hypothetical protein C8J56DRAFT_1072746 [Mycena floridula]|nr:hypothetical protein C8J56DRAFT_1072746 [Mycena floridula]